MKMILNQNQKQSSEKEVKWKTTNLTVWDDANKCHSRMTLLQSVEQIIQEWSALDYGIMKEIFEEDSVAIKSAMKKLGYYPLMNVNGKQITNSGCVFFQHYTHKKKVITDTPVNI